MSHLELGTPNDQKRAVFETLIGCFIIGDYTIGDYTFYINMEIIQFISFTA